MLMEVVDVIEVERSDEDDVTIDRPVHLNVTQTDRNWRVFENF